MRLKTGWNCVPAPEMLTGIHELLRRIQISCKKNKYSTWDVHHFHVSSAYAFSNPQAASLLLRVCRGQHWSPSVHRLESILLLFAIPAQMLLACPSSSCTTMIFVCSPADSLHRGSSSIKVAGLEFPIMLQVVDPRLLLAWV
jgi:hypothetical protein